MNKLKRLQKKLGMTAAICIAVLVVTGGIMAVTGSLASGASERKATAESGRSQDQAQLDTMKQQLEKAGDAEKRFITIQLEHPNQDFSTNSEALKDWLRSAKDQYRFADSFKLTLALEKKSEKPEFANMGFDVIVREPMKLELDAISDMHVFSFLDQFQRDPPGFVRITKVELLRKNDMNATSYRQMLTGLNADFVSAKVEFSWIGVQPPGAIPAPGVPGPDGAPAP